MAVNRDRLQRELGSRSDAILTAPAIACANGDGTDERPESHAGGLVVSGPAQREWEEKEEIYGTQDREHPRTTCGQKLTHVCAALIRPSSLQKAMWSFLYTVAAGIFSDEQLPHLIHLVKHTAFLLPDPVARVHLLVHLAITTRPQGTDLLKPKLSFSQDALDSGGEEKIKTKNDGLVWLWELQQQVNKHISDPFIFIAPEITSDLPHVGIARLLQVKALSHPLGHLLRGCRTFGHNLSSSRLCHK